MNKLKVGMRVRINEEGLKRIEETSKEVCMRIFGTLSYGYATPTIHLFEQGYIARTTDSPNLFACKFNRSSIIVDDTMVDIL